MNESINSNTQYKCYLTFYYRRTSFRAISDTLIISLDGNILPSKVKTSRSGNHGERQYVLTPDKYYMYDIQRSNSGNTYIFLRLVKVNEECQIIKETEWVLHSGKVIVTPIENLPSQAKEILLKNKDRLPLLDYVYF